VYYETPRTIARSMTMICVREQAKFPRGFYLILLDNALKLDKIRFTLRPRLVIVASKKQTPVSLLPMCRNAKVNIPAVVHYSSEQAVF
jgi:hypothetical protein